MKILVHVHLLPPAHCAGAEMMILAFSEFLRNRGHEIRMIREYQKGADGDYEYEGFKIYDRPEHESLIDLYYWSDIVITHLDITRKSIDYAKKTGRPLVHVIHNDSQLSYHRVRQDEASLVVFNSKWLADPSWHGRWVIVPPPVYAKDWHVKRNKDADAITLINLTENKGAKIFFEIAKRMPDKHFIAVLGGYGIQELPEEDIPNLEIAEHTPDIKSIYKKTRILLMPSAYESWGRVAIEAASSGIPVIAHPTPGLVESLDSGGIFVPRENIGKWVSTIRGLDCDKRYSKASKSAYERALDLDPRPSLYALEAELMLAEKYPLPVKHKSIKEENRVNVFTSREWYMDHIAPVWNALPKESRGEFYVSSNDLVDYANDIDIKNVKIGFPMVRDNRTWLVASAHDLKMVNSETSKIIMMEHGAGQVYSSRNDSYINGIGRDNVKMYLCPNEIAAKKLTSVYKDVPNVIIGSPRLDKWRDRSFNEQSNPVVVISFHWNENNIPELKSSFTYYKKVIPELKKKFNLIGHSHPLVSRQFKEFYKKQGIDFIERFEDVLEIASVYVCDNSSTIFEFAATGRPVVLLNAPWYRRDVETGLRFWSHADIGIQCNNPSELSSKIKEAIYMTEEKQKIISRISQEVFPSDKINSSSKIAVAGILSAILANNKTEKFENTNNLKNNYKIKAVKMIVMRNFLHREQSGNRLVVKGEYIIATAIQRDRYMKEGLAMEAE